MSLVPRVYPSPVVVGQLEDRYRELSRPLVVVVGAEHDLARVGDHLGDETVMVTFERQLWAGDQVLAGADALTEGVKHLPRCLEIEAEDEQFGMTESLEADRVGERRTLVITA